MDAEEAQLKIRREILTLCEPIRLLAMDVDGVLTDGTLGYDDGGGESKRFHVHDGLGLTLLRLTNIKVAWISGRNCAAVYRRATELGVEHILQGVRDKRRALSDLASQLNLPGPAIAFVGDDWNDLPAFEVVGLRIAVQNAEQAVLSAADFVTSRPGGMGAIREVCDLLLEAQGQKTATLTRYLASLKDTSLDGSGQ